MGETYENWVHKSYAANVSIALIIIILFSFILCFIKKILNFRNLTPFCGRNRNFDLIMEDNDSDNEVELMNRLDLNRLAADNDNAPRVPEINHQRHWNIFEDDQDDGPWQHLQLLRQAQAMLPPQVRPQPQARPQEQENQHAGMHRQERPRTTAEIMLYQHCIADESVWPREHFVPHVCEYSDEQYIEEASEWPHLPMIDSVRELPSPAEVQPERLRPVLRDIAAQEYGGGDNNAFYLGNFNLYPSPHRMLGLGDINLGLDQPIILPRARGIRRNPRPAYYRRRNPHTRRYERVERRPPTPPPRNWMHEDPEE